MVAVVVEVVYVVVCLIQSSVSFGLNLCKFISIYLPNNIMKINSTEILNVKNINFCLFFKISFIHLFIPEIFICAYVSSPLPNRGNQIQFLIKS